MVFSVVYFMDGREHALPYAMTGFSICGPSGQFCVTSVVKMHWMPANAARVRREHRALVAFSIA